MAKSRQMACSRRTRIVLATLLIATVVAGATALFFMPQIREGFSGPAGAKEVLLIHASWCGHCRTLLAKGGVWEQLKRELPGVAFREVEEADAADAIAKHGVKGFPDIRIVDVATGESVVEYAGARDVASLKAFVLASASPVA
jgi:thiol-disulfide isomerase/thioredoxin